MKIKHIALITYYTKDIRLPPSGWAFPVCWLGETSRINSFILPFSGITTDDIHEDLTICLPLNHHSIELHPTNQLSLLQFSSHRYLATAACPFVSSFRPKATHIYSPFHFDPILRYKQRHTLDTHPWEHLNKSANERTLIHESSTIRKVREIFIQSHSTASRPFGKYNNFSWYNQRALIREITTNSMQSESEFLLHFSFLPQSHKWRRYSPDIHCTMCLTISSLSFTLLVKEYDMMQRWIFYWINHREKNNYTITRDEWMSCLSLSSVAPCPYFL